MHTRRELDPDHDPSPTRLSVTLARACPPTGVVPVLSVALAQYVIAMMLELGVVEYQQVTPFIKQFRLLDVDGNARLGRDDLDSSCEKSLAELQLMAVKRMQSQQSMKVGDRVGLTIGSAQNLVNGNNRTSETLSWRGDAPSSASPTKAESSTLPLVPAVGRAPPSDDAHIASARLLDA